MGGRGRGDAAGDGATWGGGGAVAGARGRWGCGGAVRVESLGEEKEKGRESVGSVMDIGKHSVKSVMDRWQGYPKEYQGRHR